MAVAFTGRTPSAGRRSQPIRADLHRVRPARPGGLGPRGGGGFALGGGRLDVLVANAGIIFQGSIEATPEPVFLELVEVNLTALFRYSRACFDRMRDGGRRVDDPYRLRHGHPRLSTRSRRTPSRRRAPIAVSELLGAEGAPLGIRSNAVCPGDIFPGVQSTPEGHERPCRGSRRLGAPALRPLRNGRGRRRPRRLARVGRVVAHDRRDAANRRRHGRGDASAHARLTRIVRDHGSIVIPLIRASRSISLASPAAVRKGAPEMRRIVVGFDGSEHARKALERAADLAKARVIVACGRRRGRRDEAPGGGSTIDPADEGSLLRASPRRASSSRSAASRASYVEGTGNAADVILQEAEESGADLIIIGTRGHTSRSGSSRLREHERRSPRSLRRPRRALSASTSTSASRRRTSSLGASARGSSRRSRS